MYYVLEQSDVLITTMYCAKLVCLSLKNTFGSIKLIHNTIDTYMVF